MLTKQQKKEHVKKGKELIKESRNLVFADFTGVGVEDIRHLKSELKKAGIVFRVFKKRLLKIALKEAGIEFDPEQFAAQLGTFFMPGELSDAAGQIYKFSKDLAKKKKDFKVLGVYDITAKSFLDPEQFTVIAKLPSREILLAQLVGMLAAPIRALMYLLSARGGSSVGGQEKSKKVAT
jgi:large subunit ribosomal protein L10